MKTEVLNFRGETCIDCPFKIKGHIKIGNIEELINFLRVKSKYSFCHRQQAHVCRGAEIFKNETSPEIFKSEIDIITSHQKIPKHSPLYHIAVLTEY